MDYAQNHFQEIVKLLVIISSPAQTQITAHGIGHAEDEMAIDLAFHFTEHQESLIDGGFLSPAEVQAISKIDQFFKERNSDDHEAFWSELETHADWVTLRAMATEVLRLMAKDHLTVKITVKKATSWFSKNITTEQISVDLVDEKES